MISLRRKKCGWVLSRCFKMSLRICHNLDALSFDIPGQSTTTEFAGTNSIGFLYEDVWIVLLNTGEGYGSYWCFREREGIDCCSWVPLAHSSFSDTVQLLWHTCMLFSIHRNRRFQQVMVGPCILLVMNLVGWEWVRDRKPGALPTWTKITTWVCSWHFTS